MGTKRLRTLEDNTQILLSADCDECHTTIEYPSQKNVVQWETKGDKYTRLVIPPVKVYYILCDKCCSAHNKKYNNCKIGKSYKRNES